MSKIFPDIPEIDENEKKRSAKNSVAAKLRNKKYYRTVNIDVAKDGLVQAPEINKRKSEGNGDSSDKELSGEEYKILLRGMGFKVE